MNHHKGNLHSRLSSFAHSASSSSSSSPPFPTPNPNPNANPPLASSSFPLDPYVSLLKLQAVQRQHALKLGNFPPLSPQESSTLSFSDSVSSSPLQRVEPHRFLQSEPCVQSHVHQRVSSFFSNGDSSSSSASAYKTPLLTHKNNHQNVIFSDLPIVCGPAAFRALAQSKAAHRMDGDGRPSEDSKRLKLTLADLERELFGDDLEIATGSFFSDMATSSALDAELPAAAATAEPPAERDWTDVIEDFLSAESSSHTTTLDCSTITSISSKASMPHKAPPSHGAAHPRELLLACASAIDREDFTYAKTILSSLEQSVSTYGDPMQRLAAYMAEGLAARMELIRDGHSRLLKMMREPSPTDILNGTQVLHRRCPYFKFGYMAANGAIAEAFRNEPSIHIIDFNIGQGNQWKPLIEAFSQRPGGPPHVHITGVADPKAPTCLEGVRTKLLEVAQSVKVPFEFQALQIEASRVEPWMLHTKKGEALAVNLAFHLHRMPDESVSTSNPRDSLLRKVKAMQPKIVTLVEHDASTNTAPFYPRFIETLNYFNAVFESLDVSLPRESKERVNAEQHCLARDIVNIVACEGAQRSERYEVAGKWRSRMTMAGFRSLPLSSYINRTIKGLLQPYSPNYKLREESGALHLDWLDRGLVAASAWQ